MKITLVITTYNWKDAIELSLRSVLHQTTLPYEVIIADDGSTEETARTIRSLQKDSPVPIIHCWQPDKGFRLARSRNKAIARAAGDYIILIDGDILLDRFFILDHLKNARQGFFIQGGRAILGREVTQRVLAEKRWRVSCFAGGIGNRKNCLRSNWLSFLCSVNSRKLSGVRTCNFAFWREDALRVNGFNEEFISWGREDSEFTARLMNIGVRRKNLLFNALAYHLYHPISDRRNLLENDNILQQTIKQKLRWCEHGLKQHLL